MATFVVKKRRTFEVDECQKKEVTKKFCEYQAAQPVKFGGAPASCLALKLGWSLSWHFQKKINQLMSLSFIARGARYRKIVNGESVFVWRNDKLEIFIFWT